MTTDTAYASALATARAEKRLYDENVALKQQVAELQAQLAAFKRGAEQAKPLVEDDPLRLALVQAAIEYLRKKPVASLTRDEQCYALETICTDWKIRREHDAKDCAAAAKLKHAGLEYLATEIDWAQALSQYGRSEAVQFVVALANESDEYAVEEIIREYYAVPAHEEDCWRKD